MPLMGGEDAAARGTTGARARAAARARASAPARSATGGAWIEASDEAEDIVKTCFVSFLRAGVRSDRAERRWRGAVRRVDARRRDEWTFEGLRERRSAAGSAPPERSRVCLVPIGNRCQLGSRIPHLILAALGRTAIADEFQHHVFLSFRLFHTDERGGDAVVVVTPVRRSRLEETVEPRSAASLPLVLLPMELCKIWLWSATACTSALIFSQTRLASRASLNLSLIHI